MDKTRAMRNNQTYFIRYDQGRHSVVFAGTFDYLKRTVFQSLLEEAKDKARKPFRWPRNIDELVRTLNFTTGVLGKPADFYALTTREQAERLHWPVIEPEEKL